MRPQRSHAGLVVAIAAGVIGGAFAACSDFTPPGAASASALTVTPKTAHLNVGASMRLAATGASGVVTWSSTDEKIATVNQGKVTGVGSGTVTIRAVSGTSQATARITVTRPAAIAVSSTNVLFSGISAAAIPDSQTVDVTDAGEDPLTGLIIDSVIYIGGASDWLSARLTQAQAPARLVLRPVTTSLASGAYTATVSLSAPTLKIGPQLIDVRFTVGRAPAIVLSSGTAEFTVQQNGAAPNQQSISITNGGDAPLTGLGVGTIGYTGGVTGWLNASVTPADAPSSLLLQPNTTALAPGDYVATVPVTSTAPGVGQATVTVSYHVTSAPVPPVIVVDKSSLTFTGGRNFGTPPANQTVSISSTGTGSVSGLSVSITWNSSAINWLNTSFTGNVTTAPTTLNVQPNTTSLAAGVYSATIHVSSTTPGVATKDIPVTYFVNDLVIDQTSVQFSTNSSTPPTARVVNVSNGGSGSISNVTSSVTLLTGRADASYSWLQSSISTVVPEAPGSTQLTLTVPRADSLGDFTAFVTVSAPGMVSKTVGVTYHRLATLVDALPGLQSSKCSSCHGTSPGTAQVDFSTLDKAYGSLVDPTFNGTKYITPGDSTEAASYFVKIINGHAAASGYPNMPFSCLNMNSSCLSLDARMRIYLWIVNGAKKDPSAP